MSCGVAPKAFSADNSLRTLAEQDRAYIKEAGVAVLMVSSDIEEVVELADRAITVFQGRINGEFAREEITQDVLTSASFGIAQERTV